MNLDILGYVWETASMSFKLTGCVRDIDETVVYFSLIQTGVVSTGLGTAPVSACNCLLSSAMSTTPILHTGPFYS